MNSNKKQKTNEPKSNNQTTANEAVETVEIGFPSHYPFNDMICRAEHKELFCKLFKEGVVKKPKQRSCQAANVNLGKSTKE